MLEQHVKVGDQVYGFLFPPGNTGTKVFSSTGVIDNASFKIKRKTTTKGKFFWNKDVVADSYHEVDFRWLPFIDGNINFCFSQGVDVLSGWFSGCWMARYKQEGTWRVGHITAQKDNNDCKALWRAHKQRADVREATEFRPDKPTAKTDSPLVLGLTTATGQFYTIGLKSSQFNVVNPLDRNGWVELYNGEFYRAWDPVRKKNAIDMMEELKEVPVAALGPSAYEIIEVTGPVAPRSFDDQG